MTPANCSGSRFGLLLMKRESACLRRWARWPRSMRTKRFQPQAAKRSVKWPPVRRWPRSKSSTKLKQARDAVERKAAEWDKELFKAIKAPETLSESVVQTEIRAHLAAMTDNRLAFLDKHATDPQVVAAVFGGPPFLSGLSDADVATFKMLVARRTNPTLAIATMR